MTVPAAQVYYFTATIPGSTQLPATVTIPCTFPEGAVVGVRWRVPPGPSGFMGWQLTSDGAPVIPLQLGTYIIADDEYDTIDLAGYPDAGNWQVTGYNNDSYDHSVYLTFYVVPPGQDQAVPPGQVVTQAPFPAAALSSPPPDVTAFTAGIEVPT